MPPGGAPLPVTPEERWERVRLRREEAGQSPVAAMDDLMRLVGHDALKEWAMRIYSQTMKEEPPAPPASKTPGRKSGPRAAAPVVVPSSSVKAAAAAAALSRPHALNVCIVGGAGTGKSTAARSYGRVLQARPRHPSPHGRALHAERAMRRCEAKPPAAHPARAMRRG